MGDRVIDLTLPRLGETMEQGRIVAWLKKPGDAIRRGETVLEVETDKTVVEVPALQDGVLLETLAAPDEMVDVDAPIGRLQVAGDAAEVSAPDVTVVDFLLPRLGETMEEGRIVAWLKKPGERFRRGETILEVETDKTVVEVPVLQDGILVEILAEPDTLVPIDQPVARIEVARVADAAAVASDSAASEFAAVADAPIAAPAAFAAAPRREGEPLRASPVARRLARAGGIDLAALTGTGRRGRITGDDVRALLARGTIMLQGNDAIVETSQGPIAVKRFGAGTTGTPVVLVHGIFGDADTWTELARRVAASGRPVFALDLPGHGRSASEASTMKAIAVAVTDAVRAITSGPVRLVGHSMGAVAAVRAGLALGSALERLVLLAPAGLGRELDQGFLDGMLGARTPEALARELVKLGADPKALSASWLAGQVGRLAERHAVLSAIACAVAVEGVQQADITGDLAGLTCPITAVFGLADTIVPWQHATALPATTAVHFFKDAGHMPHWTDPALVAMLAAA
ncbi:acetoin dehydrogenase dihydrolipoyllysine-residue acetyltransferase subunit [Chthonobacter albigriseus]|uniref:acetoin dehydrogenase dihydrolipoyllysine-residue acetyltransferase subunit n=1 Tax=Chthonobacter albigriseus TaxID=1683161 RepID=UPI0015EF5BF9|nr:acetoin dehydrogenase dihydrolipoyllysine-residue acetyltransferase subunit [Chthonobacter albigriseus]